MLNLIDELGLEKCISGSSKIHVIMFLDFFQHANSGQ